jgi:ADP-ribose pyrophosphatase YjhB (NUDIX family)
VPGGGVDPGESLVEGALRECREEAGVDVVIRGILDLGSHHGGAWRRVIFLAEPTEVTSGTAAAAGGGGGDADGCSDDKMSHPTSSASPQQQQRDSSSSQWHSSSSHAFPCCSPKTLPDWESAGACWVSAEELSSIPLRSASEPCRWFPLLAGGLKGLREQLPLVDSLELPQEWAEGVFKGFPCQLIVD